MINKSTLVALIAILLMGCKNEKQESLTFKTKKGNTNNYVLQVPDFMKAADNLHDDASLQYQHLIKELYIVVIEEDTETVNEILEENGYTQDGEGYKNFCVDYFEESTEKKLNKNNLPKKKEKKLTHYPIEIETDFEKLKIFYLINYIESPKRYYQVMGWTLANRKGKHAETLEKMIYSLKELN